MSDLQGKIALITGGSRGAGRGIAIALGKAGATVYITGRSKDGKSTSGYSFDTLEQTVRMVSNGAGVKCVAIKCDHTNEDEVRQMVDQVIEEEGKIDILINNVWGGYEGKNGEIDISSDPFENNFWEQPQWRWDRMFDTGVRAHFITSKYVVPKMIEQGKGLIICTTFWDDDKYLSNLPYDVAKVAINRLIYGMSIELNKHNISCIALSPGWIRTEHLKRLFNVDDYNYKENDEMLKTESTLYIGRAIEYLAKDENIIDKTGKTMVVGDLAKEYGFDDIDGTRPPKFEAPDRSKS